MRRTVIVFALAALPILGSTATAMAAPAAPPPAAGPPVANCGFLSAVVCQIPVSIGPIPVQIGSIFSPPPPEQP